MLKFFIDSAYTSTTLIGSLCNFSYLSNTSPWCTSWKLLETYMCFRLISFLHRSNMYLLGTIVTLSWESTDNVCLHNMPLNSNIRHTQATRHSDLLKCTSNNFPFTASSWILYFTSSLPLTTSFTIKPCFSKNYIRTRLKTSWI